MRTKRPRGIVVCILLAALLAGCGSTASGRSGKSTPAALQSGTTTATTPVLPTFTPAPTDTPTSGVVPPLGPGGLPAIANGVVYVGDSDGFLYALDVAHGNILWRYQADGRVHAPAVANGIVYFGADGPSQQSGPPGPRYLYAVDATSGALRWKQSVGLGVYGPPLVSGGVVYAGTAESNLFALHANDGSQLWVFSEGGCSMGQGAADADTLYVNVQACAGLDAVRLSEGTLAWHTKPGYWGSPVPANGLVYVGACALRPADGSEVWCFKSAGYYGSTALVAQGTDVVISPTAVYALDATAGSLRWQRSDLSDAALLGADSATLYIGSADGYVRAIRLNDGTELWRVPTQAILVAAPQPEHVDGTLFVNTRDGAVAALRTSDGAVLWRTQLGGPAA